MSARQEAPGGGDSVGDPHLAKPVSKIDAIMDPETIGMSRLTAKLELIMRDEDLDYALGSYVCQLIVPGMLGQHILTQEQADRINKASSETLEASLTPEQLERVERETEASIVRDKRSPFARW